jgi:hypothetical protein
VVTSAGTSTAVVLSAVGIVSSGFGGRPSVSRPHPEDDYLAHDTSGVARLPDVVRPRLVQGHLADVPVRPGVGVGQLAHRGEEVQGSAGIGVLEQ